MLKVTQKKVMQRVFRLDSDRGQILWDSKKNNKVDLELIREVRIGAAAASYRISLSIAAAHESRWITIIYQTGGAYKALNLIALSQESLQRWRSTLERVQRLRRDLMGSVDMLNARQHLWLRQHWRAGDASQDEKLDFEEVVRLCRRLGIESSRKDLEAKFKEADPKAEGYLDFAAFQQFVSILKHRADVEAIFDDWADARVSLSIDPNGGGKREDEEIQPEASEHTTAAMSREAFKRFLVEVQRHSPADAEVMDAIYDKHCEPALGHVLFAGFNSFLLSSDNPLISDHKSDLANKRSTAKDRSLLVRARAQTTDELLQIGVCDTPLPTLKATQDMSLPLSDYFISSSHNTYLVGGQWKGDSTVEGYIRALQWGARSVELDCWDGPNDTPQITHGHTLTSKVPFADVIEAIGKYAFINSPYPIILSLEVHNDIPQQDVMAAILKQKLGGMLLSEKLTGKDGKDALPSPDRLKGKILIKTKNLLLSEDAPISEVDAGNKPAAQGQGQGQAPAISVPAHERDTSTDTTESESEVRLKDFVRSLTQRRSRESALLEPNSKEKSRNKKVMMSASLASLLVYTVGVKHRGINKKVNYAIEHMISLSEKSALKYAKTAPEDLIKHNLTHLTRIYPSMASIARLHASANFMPHDMWATGSQLVALNWQTLDLGFELNHALFSRNERCGYVLKPEALRIKELHKNSPTRLRFEVEVMVVSAQQLPRFRDSAKNKDSDEGSVINPFVSLSIHAPLSWGAQPSFNTGRHSRSASASSGEGGLLRKVSSRNSAPVQLPEEPVNGQKRSSAGSVAASSSSSLNVPTATAAAASTSNANAVPTTSTPCTSEDVAHARMASAESNKISTLLSSSPASINNGSRPSMEVKGRHTSTSFFGSNGGAKVPSQGQSSSRNPASGARTSTIKSNGFNPQWQETMKLAVDLPAGASAACQALVQKADEALHQQQQKTSLEEEDLVRGGISWREMSRGLLDLTFLRMEVCDEEANGDASCVAAYTASLGALQPGYRHVPLYDAQLTPYMFSTLFIRTRVAYLGSSASVSSTPTFASVRQAQA
ncbi:Phosphoinositide-specific phospholipase C [Ceraceosorus bombacis]|uniref:Phosphoinositide phospholipase C n=1 Tax=Ceraceosorus bombacis TaxID=401625 RepID=A0A0P1BDZ5_9BASI|nr:Phosphoinositide-specific phospholipase C [Ceraceosorus bombacis]